MTKPLERVTVTLPGDLVRNADDLARRLDRSRSWVVAEALRRQFAAAARKETEPAVVSESQRSPYAVQRGLGPQRTAQLQSDMKLTPSERVRAAEELVEVALRLHPQPQGIHVMMFDSLKDYYQWKKGDVL